MMKKKLVCVLFAFAGLIAFSQTEAEARPHKPRHHSVHRTAHKHRVAIHAPRGWWLGQHLGIPRRELWIARNWASVGSRASAPGIGVVVVWRHHVGIITGRAGSQWVVKSGNDGNAVRERPRSISGAIAFRHLGGGATRS
jgi:hypothetical protein